MTAVLRQKGELVNVKRVRRLLRKLGLQAWGPQPNLSRKHPQHQVYPDLLRGVEIQTVNQVWSTDITSIRLNGGFVYVIAVIAWYSRSV